MPELLSRSLEYLLLLLVVVVVAVVVVSRYGGGGDGESAGEAARETSRTELPTCEEAGLTPTSRREGTCRTESATLTIVDQGSELVLPQVVVRVNEAELELAQTPTGRAADRSRLTLGVSMRNPRSRPFRLDTEDSGLYVVAAGERIDFDRNATDLPGALAVEEPIPPQDGRAGFLRFELAGAQTREIVETERAQLGVRVSDARIGVVRLRVG